jgi:hypothetical protein
LAAADRSESRSRDPNDRAIELLTFASGRWRAEIAALDVEDLDFSRPGFLLVTIRKSKTNQGGAGSSSGSRGRNMGRARSRRSKRGSPLFSVQVKRHR